MADPDAMWPRSKDEGLRRGPPLITQGSSAGRIKYFTGMTKNAGKRAFCLGLTGDYGYIVLSVAILATGCTIASDLYVSAVRRGTAQRTPRSPLVENLEAFYRYAQQKL